MRLLYRAIRRFGRFTFFCTMRTDVLGESMIRRDGAYVLAVTHLSHLEPVFASILNHRQIEWMTRREFYRWRLSARLLDAVNAFEVNRHGIPVSAIREAIRRLKLGRIVGIFPEGGVVRQKQAAIRGGPIKKGCCSIAIRAGVPIVPCVMLGTHKLNAVKPWLPFKRARLWIAYGEPIFPSAGSKSTRATRAQLAEKLTASYQDLYAQLRQQFGVCDSEIP